MADHGPVEYATATGLELVPEPSTLAFAGRDRYRRPGARAQLGGEAASRASAQARASAASSTATSAWSTAQAA